MAIDATVQQQLDQAVGSGTVNIQRVLEQNALLILTAAEYDKRRLSGFLDAQLFDIDTMQSKAAFQTPTGPMTPSSPATAAH